MLFNGASAYLKDAASAWFQEEQAAHNNRIVRWKIDNVNQVRNQALRESLIDQFRTAANERQWQLELDRRTQKKEETVEQYATDFEKLLKRVDPARAIPEGTRCHMFMRGLNPAIQYQLQNYLACTDNITFRGIVMAARQYETAQAHHLNTLAQTLSEQGVGLAAVAPAQPTIEPMQELMKQMAQLLQPMATAITQLQQQMVQPQQRQPPQPRQQFQAAPAQNQTNQQWRQRQPRNTLTCHRCGQFGHIARICPNPLAPQVPQQPAVPTQPQPTLFATMPQSQQLATRNQPLYANPQQDVTQQVLPQAQSAKNVRFSSPAQIPRPDTANFCVSSEQDNDYLNF